ERGRMKLKFMNVSRYHECSNKIVSRMKQHLIDFNLQYDEETPELVISVGGDGTFLEAFRMYVHRLKETAFIGVHTGHLGFYADWTSNEVEKLVIDITKSQYDIVEYQLLKLKINFSNKQENVKTIDLN